MPFQLTRHGEKEHFIGAFAPTGQGWGIFAQAHDEDVYWLLDRTERSTQTWTLVLLVIAGLAAIFFARTLSDPINRLAAASRALAAGDLSTRVSVRPRNEIGELAHAFNRMAAKIQAQVTDLRELFEGTIGALAQAIDAKDPYTHGHSGRVQRYSVIIARELGRLSEEELENIKVASLLHDVGKIGISDEILKKNGELTAEQFEEIKKHPVLGANIMEPIRQMQSMIPGLKHHHERRNGTGYPDGLKGEDIPLMARIIAVADTFDAITTNRPYQSRMGIEQAVARINALAGDALDPEVVAAFNRAHRAGRIRVAAEDGATDGVVPRVAAARPVAGAG
jgi:HD-GYP domain-containing protein (c-di-GMP phosphodiesterase class II)